MAAHSQKSIRQSFRRNLEGYLLISPWLIGLVVFTLGPILVSLGMSFTDWDILRSPNWVGLENYIRAFTSDRLYRQAFLNTLVYVAGSVPLSILLALFLAVLVNRPMRGMRFWRTVFYVPSVVSLVAMGLLWRWILHSRVGVLNNLLLMIGVKGPSWLGSPAWAKPALILVSLVYIGPMMVVFIAGLKGIPKTLYESAELDGAASLAMFRHITLPMLSPTIFFNLVTSVIHAFQVFALVVVMFAGASSGGAHGPMNSTLVYSLYLYEEAFEKLHMGYASALGWILFIVILTITLLQLRFSSWVYYEGGLR